MLRSQECEEIFRNIEEMAEIAAVEAQAASNERVTERLSESIGEREWPKPLAQQAFHGIAGEFVRAIEPHTEADPAALLFQFLVGFGNVVGRAPHTIADGARHGCNLFAAIVGVSSKGRKGTSWNHIRRVFEGIEPEWTSKRIQGGLSSGEGLIWGVRDPIE